MKKQSKGKPGMVRCNKWKKCNHNCDHKYPHKVKFIKSRFRCTKKELGCRFYKKSVCLPVKTKKVMITHRTKRIEVCNCKNFRLFYEVHYAVVLFCADKYKYCQFCGKLLKEEKQNG